MTDRTHDELVEQLHYAQSAVTALHALSQQHDDPTGNAMDSVAYLAGRLSDHLSAAGMLALRFSQGR